MSVDIRLEDSERAKYIWIFRKWNGQAVVYPSPAILKAGSPVQIVNKTGEEANVAFPVGFMSPKDLCIPPGDAGTTTPTKTSDYFEYDVSFTRPPGPPSYAEGGSRPGVIVEH